MLQIKFISSVYSQ